MNNLIPIPIRVAQIAATIAKLDKIPVQSTRVEDIGFDSIDEIEFGMLLEEEFGIEIPDIEADSIRTIAIYRSNITRRRGICRTRARKGARGARISSPAACPAGLPDRCP